MYIRRKVFSRIQDEAGEVKMFSTTDYELGENKEVRMFSKMEDDDYEKGINDDRKSNKILNRVLGGSAGAAGGAVLGRVTRDVIQKATKSKSIDPKLAAALSAGSTVAGAVGGWKLAKKADKKVDKKADEDIEKYRKASKSDKKYLREKRQRAIDRREARRNADIIAGAVAAQK